MCNKENITSNDIPSQVKANKNERGFSRTELRKRKAEHLRAAVAGFKWGRVSGRNNKAILQAHIKRWAGLGVVVTSWHMDQRLCQEMSGVSRKGVIDGHRWLLKEGWLKLMPSVEREGEEGKSLARTFAFTPKLLAFLDEDVDHVAPNSIPGQGNDYYLSKSKSFKSAFDHVLCALRNRCTTVKDIAKYTGLHRTTVVRTLGDMERYSVAFKVGQEVRLNPKAMLVEIAEAKGTIHWLENLKDKNQLEREYYNQLQAVDQENRRYLASLNESQTG